MVGTLARMLFSLAVALALVACGGGGSSGAASPLVPNVVGQAQSTAANMIVSAGFVVGAVTTETSPAVVAGSVISQVPAAGTSAVKGSAVNIVVSSGPPISNRPPSASFLATPRTGVAPLVVEFDATASSDPDGSIAGYSWNVGDGSSLSGAVVSHTYSVAGTYTVVLTVTDNTGATGSATSTVSVAAAPSSSVKVTVSAPRSGAFVPDELTVRVAVDSTYEIDSVTAELAGRQAVLLFDSKALGCPLYTCPGYVGELFLAGVPVGPQTLNVVAKDVRGNVGTFSVGVVHDNPPSLTVTQPLDLSVALPTIAYQAACDDDAAGCVVEVLVDNFTSKTGPSLVTGTLDLTPFIGQSVYLRFRARDSAGQEVGNDRKVFVEDGTRLAAVGETTGEVVDLDATRLLFVEATEQGDVIGAKSRTSGLVERLPLPASQLVFRAQAFLTPSGAIFVSQPAAGTVLDARVFLWKDGVLNDLGKSDSAASLRIAGRYAIWNNGSVLYRLDTAGLTPSVVSTEAGNWKNSVAADGTVVFWTSAGRQIVRDVAGQQTTLTSGTSEWHVWPVTDGSNVVYRLSEPYPSKENAIVLITGGTSVALASKREWDPVPESERDYQTNGGWVAFTDLGTQDQRHVFARSPNGTVTRYTDFAKSSVIDWLAGNGEVMLINDGKRFFSRGTGAVAISSAAGQSYWIAGSWYVAIGRTVFAANTQN